MNAQAAESPTNAEPTSPFVAGVSEDGRWTMPVQGGRLKRGGDHERTGRPKKDVRQSALRGADASVGWALRIMDSARPDEDPLRVKAAELLLRYGLGTSDEVEIANERQTLEAMARALQGEVDSDTAMRIAAKFADHLGLK